MCTLVYAISEYECFLEWHEELLSAIRPLNPTWNGDTNMLPSVLQTPV